MKNWAKKKYKKNEVCVTKSQQSLCKMPFNWAFLRHGLKSNGEMQRFSSSFSAFVSICMALFKVFLSTFWKKDGIYLTFLTKNYLSFKLNIDGATPTYLDTWEWWDCKKSDALEIMKSSSLRWKESLHKQYHHSCNTSTQFMSHNSRHHF